MVALSELLARYYEGRCVICDIKISLTKHHPKGWVVFTIRDVPFDQIREGMFRADQSNNGFPSGIEKIAFKLTMPGAQRLRLGKSTEVDCDFGDCLIAAQVCLLKPSS